MKNFVRLIEQIHAQRYMKVLTEIGNNRIPVAFLSTSDISEAVAEVKKFRGMGLNITRLFVTNNPPPVNLDFEVIHVSDAANIYPQPEYVFVNNFTEIDARVALKNFPASKVISLNRGNTEHIYETFMAHLDELREVYESLIDEESRGTFRGYWLGNISNRLGEFTYSNAAHYRLVGFLPKAGDVVIDAGACDGGTAAIFAEMGCKVYAFELDKANYEMSLTVAEEKNFVLENMGLGAYETEMKYSVGEHPGASHLNSNGNETAFITSIDSYVCKKKLSRVDFIKLDVEGTELDVLKGAVTTIARFKPILVLSAYHKWDDFWTLMNFVKSIRPDYEFAMRQFADTVETVPSVFTPEKRSFSVSLGLEPEFRNWCECVLFAR